MDDTLDSPTTHTIDISVKSRTPATDGWEKAGRVLPHSKDVVHRLAFSPASPGKLSMFPFHQHFWFGLAGACLVGSLVVSWSSDVDVVPEPTRSANHANPDAVVRSLSNLPPPEFTVSSTQISHTEAPGHDAGEVIIQAPAAIAGRMASPMNTEARIISKDRVLPTGYQQTREGARSPAVWLSGEIEILDSP